MWFAWQSCERQEKMNGWAAGEDRVEGVVGTA